MLTRSIKGGVDMWSISDLKKKGKAAFKSNYWRCVLVALILSILTAGSSASGSGNSAKNAEQLNVLIKVFVIAVFVWVRKKARAKF